VKDSVPKVNKSEKQIAWAVSITLAVIVLITAVIRLNGLTIFDEYILLAIVIALFPAAVLDYVDYHWRRSIDEHLPDLFRAIVQAEKTGMTLPQAVEEAAKRRYGALTFELRRMVVHMSWGKSFEEVFQSFSERVNTSLTKRSVPLVVEASRSGGHVEEVFEPMGKFVQSTLNAEKERQAQTRPYIAIVYVAFFVFLFTVIMLFKTFFFQVTDVPSLNTAMLSSEEARKLFFHMSIVQALFSGLVAGKMGEGTVSAGLKHSVIMLIAGYVALKFLI
jgi:flagellar protein FlaJ